MISCMSVDEEYIDLAACIPSTRQSRFPFRVQSRWHTQRWGSHSTENLLKSSRSRSWCFGCPPFFAIIPRSFRVLFGTGETRLRHLDPKSDSMFLQGDNPNLYATTNSDRFVCLARRHQHLSSFADVRTRSVVRRSLLRDSGRQSPRRSRKELNGRAKNVGSAPSDCPSGVMAETVDSQPETSVNRYDKSPYDT